MEVDAACSVIGAVLCGGRSTRFGSDKALAAAGDQLVGERVISGLRTGGVDPVVAIGGTAGDALRIPTVPDRRPGGGPLGGLATALLWARSGLVVVVPCDLVLLSGRDVRATVDAAVKAEGRPAIALVDDRPALSLGCWPADLGRRLLTHYDAGHRSFRSALDDIEWVPVEVDPTSVLDADSPDELAQLLAEPLIDE